MGKKFEVPPGRLRVGAAGRGSGPGSRLGYEEHDGECERRGVAKSVAGKVPGGLTREEYALLTGDDTPHDVACYCMDRHWGTVSQYDDKAELRARTILWISSRRGLEESGGLHYVSRALVKARTLREAEIEDRGNVIRVDFLKRARC